MDHGSKPDSETDRMVGAGQDDGSAGVDGKERVQTQKEGLAGRGSRPVLMEEELSGRKRVEGGAFVVNTKLLRSLLSCRL